MNSQANPEQSPPFEYDPTFLNSRKEAIIIFIVWGITLVWTIPYCYFFGYNTEIDPENIKTVFGIPSWIFWGIAFPWMLSNIFTIWFCLFYMKDDDLGDDPTPQKSSEGEVQE